MLKKVSIIFICMFIISASGLSFSYAADSYDRAEAMATEIHKKVESDVIYTDQEIKALYYQNIQIIGLLGEIRDLLKEQAAKEA